MKYEELISTLLSIHNEGVQRSVQAVNHFLVMRNWAIGAYLIEFEQNGEDRAAYGEQLLVKVSRDMSSSRIKGISDTMLRYCRRFFLVYPQIQKTLSSEFHRLPISLKFDESNVEKTIESIPIKQLKNLSWSHLIELIKIDDPLKRRFYENECVKGGWSVRQLQRQIGSLLFERTGLSTDKKSVVERAHDQEVKLDIKDLIRDPYILEFTGLQERPQYSEDDLENALLDHLQFFLLELGNGFCFEARQFRMTVDNEHDRVDLVFYHRRLRCHVLIDLKIRKFKHADAGQMNFYLSWFKSNMMEEGDNPPIGILLCSDRSKTKAEYATAGLDNQVFVSRYLVALPNIEELKRFIENDRERIEASITQNK